MAVSIYLKATLMPDVTRILSAIEEGDTRAAGQLLPLVYHELRKLAAQRMTHEKPGQTLQATALVHEAYIQLVDAAEPQDWDSRGHFFAAAAEAMRRILVDIRCSFLTKRGAHLYLAREVRSPGPAHRHREPTRRWWAAHT